MAQGEQKLAKRNRRTMMSLTLVVSGMIGLSFASVPLYDLFCRVTGFGGTTQVAEEASDKVLDRKIRIQFDASTNSDLPWHFKPAQREVELKVGQTGLAFYTARNDSGRRTAGTAAFNVTPQKAGLYFSKIDCFCFTEQVLEPGEQVEMPVTFFVDPEIADNPNLDDVTVITLSYTFFEQELDEDDQSAQKTDSKAEEVAALSGSE